MGKKLVLENVPLNKTVKDLLAVLDPIGTVQWVFMVSEDQNRFTGQAYVEMWSDTEAELVVKELQSQPIDGQPVSARMIKNEETPEMAVDKTPILQSPSDYIYSVIRYQVSGPPGSVVFINNIPKTGIDDTGAAVIRALLPGTYEVKVIFENQLLISTPLSVNCDEEPPRMTVTMEAATALREDQLPLVRTAQFSAIRTQFMSPIYDANATVVMRRTDESSNNIVESSSGGGIGRYALVAIVLIAIAAGSVIGYQKFVATPAKEPDKTPAPTITTPENMVLIPVTIGKKFIVGRDSSAESYQRPAHEVSLSASYFMDKTEVTNEQYLKFVQDTKRKPPKNWGGSVPPASLLQLPVTFVSWDDASDYCKWKGSRSNSLICRLPSEFEWEHAARGENNSLYSWGNDWQSGFANADNPKGKINAVDTHPGDVSPYGIKDMMGNVREWTKDYLTVYPGSKAPYVPGVRVARGGAFSDDPDIATATYRAYLPPENEKDRGYDRTGFRCVCEVPVSVNLNEKK